MHDFTLYSKQVNKTIFTINFIILGLMAPSSSFMERIIEPPISNSIHIKEEPGLNNE